MKQNTDIRK